jgi:hypothetical protein
LKALEARARQATASCRAAGAASCVAAAYSLASVLPSSGMNALQAHQVSTAVTAANTPLSVARRSSGVNSCCGVGARDPRARLASQGALSRRKSRTAKAINSGARPARKTYRQELCGSEANQTPAI